MTPKNKTNKVIPVLALAAFHLPLWAYELPTHYDLSRQAFSRSTLAEPSIWREIGVDAKWHFQSTNGEDSPDFTDGCAHGRFFTVQELVACGAQFEDHPGSRALNHFFDPANDRPLTVFWEWGDRSPDWALTSSDYSYAVARQAFFSALTDQTGSAARDAQWGLLFQSLGQVIHHLQDMAQPQHVRNDQHLDKPWAGPFQNPSHYEKYTAAERDRLEAIMGAPGSEAVFRGHQRGSFRVPRDFWQSGQTGIAQFTNRNFLSAGTTFEVVNDAPAMGSEYVLPGWTGVSGTVDAMDIDPPLSPQVREFCSEGGTSCALTFYATQEDIANPRAASLSIFDQHLRRRNVYYLDGQTELAVDRIFTLNRYTFETAYPHLLPRAVAYSAGLINFFFRGKLEIGLPEEGVYAAVDHLTPEGSTKDTGGFRSLKVNVRNLTPGGLDAYGEPLVEPMPADRGYFWAVAKFRRNNCYQPDLSREYGSIGPTGEPLASWQGCRSSQDEIVVSQPIATPPGIDVSPQALTFIFPDRIPINASDVILQVVYRGQLGSESDAVVVTTKDISEPSYIYSLPERYDQFMRAHFPIMQEGPYGWEEWCAQGGMTLEQCNDEYGHWRKWRFAPYGAYDPDTQTGETKPIEDEPPFHPVLSAGVHVGTFGRVAVLTDLERPADAPYPLIAGPYYLYLKLSETGVSAPDTYTWNWGGFRVTENQLDPATGTLTPSVRYKQARGVFLYEGADQFYSEGSATNVPPLQPVNTTVNFPLPAPQ